MTQKATRERGRERERREMTHWGLAITSNTSRMIAKESSMQKRRTAPVLPVTAGDASKPLQSRRPRIPANGKASSSDPHPSGKILLALFLFGLVALGVQRTSVFTTSETASGRVLEDGPDEEPPKPLAGFPSLQYALDNSQIVGLYFAASWCPMSTPVTKLIDEKLGDILLPPPSSEPDETLLQRSGISLVYVSSDRNAEEMDSYLQRNWMAVPFDSDDRSDLKRHFRTCAKRELEPLEMEREYEIPTLILVSGETHQVLTYSGVQELKEHGEQAVDHWLELDRISTALESKYDSV